MINTFLYFFLLLVVFYNIHFSVITSCKPLELDPEDPCLKLIICISLRQSLYTSKCSVQTEIAESPVDGNFQKRAHETLA